MISNLLLLHGALGSQNQFTALKEKLSDAFQVHTFNFSGHGGKPLPSAFSIARFVNDTLQEMDLQGMTSTHIFGYSMGGYVALQAARDHPDKIQKIMTLGTKLQWDPESAEKEVRMMDPALIEQKIPAFAALLKERHHPADWKRIMVLTGDMMLDLGNGSAMTASDFQRIHHEVLLGIGSRDQMVTIAETEMVSRQLPHGTCRILENWKHPIEMVDVETLCKEIADFFEYGDL